VCRPAGSQEFRASGTGRIRSNEFDKISEIELGGLDVAIATSTFADGFVFTEGPRWRDERLWCVDMHDHRIVAIDEDGTVQTVAEVFGDEPSGLGWLADGRLIVVSMERGEILRLEPDGSLVSHADLSAHVFGSLNDMIVADDGTAYVGDMGMRIHGDGERRPGHVFRVTPDGSFDVAADDMHAPNGMALTPDERTLLVAESAGLRITAFDRAEDGTLSNRRIFASLTPGDPAAGVSAPDGMCLDDEGAVWYADPVGRRVVRVLEGGAVTDVVSFAPETPVACVLGGADRRTLHVCAAMAWRRDELAGTRAGRIASLGVSVPGAGRP
jgi:sugar lactone lactonase YvrE